MDDPPAPSASADTMMTDEPEAGAGVGVVPMGGLPLWRAMLRAMGARELSEYGRIVLEVSAAAGLRTRENWLIPGLASVLMAIAVLVFEMTGRRTGGGFAHVMVRIVFFDFLVFALAMVSGWNMARRWRKSETLTEEIAVSGMRPTHTFAAATVGTMSPWFYCIAALMVVELPLILLGMFNELPNEGSWVPESNAGMVTAAAMLTLAMVPTLVLLAWFHFETVRLVHSAFAMGLLPNIPLVNLFVSNAVQLGFQAMVFAMLGGALTAVATIPYQMLEGVGAATRQGFLTSDMCEELAWMLASIAGLLLIIRMKRDACDVNRRNFGEFWCMWLWWGAAETDHPVAYPAGHRNAASLWCLYHEAKELAEAPDATAKEQEAAKKRYLAKYELITAWQEGPPPPGQTHAEFRARRAPPAMHRR